MDPYCRLPASPVLEMSTSVIVPFRRTRHAPWTSGVTPPRYLELPTCRYLVFFRKQLKPGVPINTREGMWQVFADKMQTNVHVILCHSPVGEHLRVRARKFPGLISGTTIDEFHPWSRDALVHTGTAFLKGESVVTERL